MPINKIEFCFIFVISTNEIIATQYKVFKFGVNHGDYTASDLGKFDAFFMPRFHGNKD